MRKMFLLLPALLMVLISMNSCTKKDADTDPLNFFLRFKANGIQKEYKANVAGNFNRPLGGATEYVSSIGGTMEQFESKKSNMAIGLTTVGTNSLNVTYTNYSTLAAGLKKAKLLQFAFFDENGEFYMSWGDEFVSLLPAGSPINCRLVITEATSSFIKGTFSGTIYNQGYTARMDITDGEFFLDED